MSTSPTCRRVHKRRSRGGHGADAAGWTLEAVSVPRPYGPPWARGWQGSGPETSPTLVKNSQPRHI